MDKILSIRGACLHMAMKDGETKDEAVGRLLDKLDEAKVHLALWTEEAEEDDEVTAEQLKEEKQPEYPCINCCSPSERAACCGCPKERQWQERYGNKK